MEPPKGAKVVTTNVAKIWITDENIVIRKSYPGSVTSLDNAVENVEATAKLSNHTRLPLLVDMRKIKGISGEARNYYTKADNISALALWVDSPLSMLIGNFFIGLNKTIIPTKIFTKESNAMKWLKKFLEK